MGNGVAQYQALDIGFRLQQTLLTTLNADALASGDWASRQHELVPGFLKIRGTEMLSRAKWFACTLVTLAVIAFLFIGGPIGVFGAITSFSLGVWYLASRSKFTIKPGETEKDPLLELDHPVPEPKGSSSEILVTVKEVHAYSPGTVGEVGLVKDSKLELEIFIRVWLVSETETATRVQDVQLQIRHRQGAITVERIAGDLENWFLDYDKEESDMWDTHFERVRERLVELNTTKLIECGVPREGWLHFRLRNISASEYRAAEMELCIEDSSSLKHIGIVNTTRYLSGQAQKCELGDPPHISPLGKPILRV